MGMHTQSTEQHFERRPEEAGADMYYYHQDPYQQQTAARQWAPVPPPAPAPAPSSPPPPPPSEVLLSRGVSKKRRRPRFRYGRVINFFLLVFFATTFYVAIVIYARVTDWAEALSRRRARLSARLEDDVSTTIAVVRVLQGLLLAASSFALTRSFYVLQWGLVSRSGRAGRAPDGVSYRELLALSPSTLDWGAFRLFIDRNSSSRERMWAGVKLSLYLFVWLCGLLLFFRTSLVTVFDTVNEFDATAGVGPFNSTYVQPFLDELAAISQPIEGGTFNSTVLPYSFYGTIQNLVMDPFYSTVADPIECKGVLRTECSSYILTGGLMAMTPWLPPGFDDFPSVRLDNVPSLQVEFERTTNRKFDDEDCTIYGSNKTLIAAKFCLHEEDSGSLQAGMFVCKNGLEDEACQSNQGAPNITTRLTFFRREATVFASYSNLTVTQLTDLTQPRPSRLDDVAMYRAALAWVLDYERADMPAPSSILQAFWSGWEQLEAGHSLGGVLMPTFHGLLAFPAWLFNANNFGNADLPLRVIADDLPPEFYTRASIVAPYVKLRFDPLFFNLFVGLQGLALVFLWAVLVWGFFISAQLPDISSFPAFDVAYKALPCHTEELQRRADVWEEGDTAIMNLMEGVRVHGRKGWV